MAPGRLARSCATGTVFASAEEQDVTLKVGGGDTAAALRIADTTAAREVLQRLRELRGEQG